MKAMSFKQLNKEFEGYFVGLYHAGRDEQISTPLTQLIANAVLALMEDMQATHAGVFKGNPNGDLKAARKAAASVLGQSKTPAKKAASVKNGKLGGRPKKGL